MPWTPATEVTEAELAEVTAARLAAAIGHAVATRGIAHVAFSGGRTPVPAFEVLAGLTVPWGSTHVWQVDERSAPDGDPARNSTALRAGLLDPVGLPEDHVHLMPVTPVTPVVSEQPPSPAGAAEGSPPEERRDAYEEVLRDACTGVLDVVHLGLGADGHTASWVPGDPLVDSGRDVEWTTGRYQGWRRMTLTPRCVNRARFRLLVVGGADKADAVARYRAGDPTIPATRLDRFTELLVGRVR